MFACCYQGLCVCVSVLSCVCVPVPKLQHLVELLCARFCYVMKNHIRIHFTDAQACVVVTVHLLLLFCPSPSAIAHYMSSTPPSLQTTTRMARKRVLSLPIRMCIWETCVCRDSWLSVCTCCIRVHLWLSGVVHVSARQAYSTAALTAVRLKVAFCSSFLALPLWRLESC